MFSCPLHNWFSYESPCPACQKQITSVTDIVINAEGTDATNFHPSGEIKQLQKELEYWKQRCEAAEEYHDVRDKWANGARLEVAKQMMSEIGNAYNKWQQLEQSKPNNK